VKVFGKAGNPREYFDRDAEFVVSIFHFTRWLSF